MAPPSLWSSLLSLLAPERCASCDGWLRDGPAAGGTAPVPLGGASLFCPGCAVLLEPVAGSHGDESFAPVAAGFVYGGPLAVAIQRLKYGGRSDLAGPLGEMLVEGALLLAGSVDRVMPIPQHASRLRQRGFNQSALLARPVARALGVPLDVQCLARVRPTRDQAGLAKDERAHNLRGAFAAQAMRGGRVLLVDDVRTTGATLAEAAHALLRAGASEVHTFALARVAP